MIIVEKRCTYLLIVRIEASFILVMNAVIQKALKQEDWNYVIR